MSTSTLCSSVRESDHLGVRRALQDGEDPNTCMPWEFTEIWTGRLQRVPVLIVAIAKKNVDVVNILLEANVNIEFRGDCRATPLYYATSWGFPIVVEKLLNHGADIHARDLKNSSMVIHAAARNNFIELVKMLYVRGSRLDPLTHMGNTPLHSAAYHGHKNVVQWLVVHGQDVKALTNNGKSAADLADSKGHKEVAEWLRSCEDNLATMVSRLRIPRSRASSGQVRQHNKKIYILNYIEFRNQTSTRFGSTTMAQQIEKRDGANIDSQNLSTTFRKLGYDVNLHENKTADQTNIILDYIQQDHNLEFLLLIVLSHGLDDDTFYTSDGYTYSLKSIQQRFTDKECPQLKGRSKIILANFCRGKNIEEMIPTSAYKHRDFNQIDAMSGYKEPPHQMITIHASHEGFAAVRDINKGTAFVHNLCEVLREQVSQHPIQETFNQVFERIQMNGGQTPEMKVSVPFPNFQF